MEIGKYQLESQQAPNDDKRAIYSNQAMDSFESQTYSYKWICLKSKVYDSINRLSNCQNQIQNKILYYDTIFTISNYTKVETIL